jgi:hypothetical protein
MKRRLILHPSCVRLLWGLVGLAALLLIAFAAATRPARAAFPPIDREPPPPPRVTLISDSSAATLLWHADARAYLAEGLDLRIEALACRKLIAPGCYAYGGNPPSALETIRTLGTELGPLVVIDVGYNDGPDGYAEGLDMVMQALVDAHVERVIWMTLNEHEDVWIENNTNIRDAPKRWPQLVVADWAPVAAENPPWFADLVHLNAEGAVGFAHFLRPIILTVLTNCARACELTALSASSSSKHRAQRPSRTPARGTSGNTDLTGPLAARCFGRATAAPRLIMGNSTPKQRC